MVESRRIGFIVEGPSDGLVIKTLLKDTDIIPMIRVLEGSKVLTDSSWVTGHLYEAGAKLVLALKDSHCCPDVNKYKEWVCQRMGSVQGLTVCIVVHAIESWLLADEEALRDYLRGSIQTQHTPEKHCKPEEILNDLFHQHGRTYFKRSDAPAIASRVRKDIVKGRCPSFACFLRSINL